MRKKCPIYPQILKIYNGAKIFIFNVLAYYLLRIILQKILYYRSIYVNRKWMLFMTFAF